MSASKAQLSKLVCELQDTVENLLALVNLEANSVFEFDCRSKLGDIKFSSRNAQTDYAKIAKYLYFCRRKRDQVLDIPGVFGEPAWDMLLDLMIAYEREERLSVSAVTVGSGVPPTTAIRYIGVLESRGLVERIPDKNDARRTWVRLSKAGALLMRRAIDSMVGNSLDRDTSGLLVNYEPSADHRNIAPLQADSASR